MTIKFWFTKLVITDITNGLLEPCAVKIACTVLRGRRNRKISDLPGDNLRAAQLAITYLWRALEEYGVTSEAQTLDRIFAQFFLGFAATPDDTVLLLGSGEEDWSEVLGVEPDADQAAIRNAYRALARRHHPDAGGDPAQSFELRRAYEQALAQLDRDGG